MKLRIKFIIMVLFTGSMLSAQQIGDGYAPSAIADFSAPLKSGIYNGLSSVTAGMAPDGSHLWQHLIVARHTNTTNNFQLQINSSFTDNDRLFFRKIVAGSLVSVNSRWIELATRGTNNFIGNQTIMGNVGIGTNTPSNIQGWNKVLDVAGLGHSKILATTDNSLFRVGIYSHTTWLGGGGFIGTESNHALHFITNYIAKMSILTNGNVGIGIINPSNKLDVNGTIHSKEVKVDMTGWSDFVFKNDYSLPTLQEVEKHIVEKGHLQNMPSEEEVLTNGINLGEMNAKLLQKIEELTLYIIEQNKQIIDLKQRLDKVEVNSK